MSSSNDEWKVDHQEMIWNYLWMMKEDQTAREVAAGLEDLEDLGGPGGLGGPPWGVLGGGPMVTGPNVPRGGGWCGTPPSVFDGDRKKTKDFMDDFDLYMGLNRGMVQVTNSSQRVYFCLNMV
jgi:hypothetical protein